MRIRRSWDSAANGAKTMAIHDSMQSCNHAFIQILFNGSRSVASIEPSGEVGALAHVAGLALDRDDIDAGNPQPIRYPEFAERALAVGIKRQAAGIGVSRLGLNDAHRTGLVPLRHDRSDKAKVQVF